LYLSIIALPTQIDFAQQWESNSRYHCDCLKDNARLTLGRTYHVGSGRFMRFNLYIITSALHFSSIHFRKMQSSNYWHRYAGNKAIELIKKIVVICCWNQTCWFLRQVHENLTASDTNLHQPMGFFSSKQSAEAEGQLERDTRECRIHIMFMETYN